MLKGLEDKFEKKVQPMVEAVDRLTVKMDELINIVKQIQDKM